MNRIEQLISDYGSLNFYFKSDMPEGLGGLISDNNVYVSANEPFERIYSNLAEEIGHFETAPGDIIDQSIIKNRKFELAEKHWSYAKLVPYDQLDEFIKRNGTVYLHELAEEFEVPDDVMEEAINMYRSKGFI